MHGIKAARTSIEKTEQHIITTVTRTTSYSYHVDLATGCHIWDGPTVHHGLRDYPILKYSGFYLNTNYVLRNLWIAKYGHPGKGLKVSTTCDNSLCVNLEHACYLRFESSTGTVMVADDLTDTNLSKQRKYQLRRRREGNCMQCGKPSSNHAHCNVCRPKQIKLTQASRSRAKAAKAVLLNANRINELAQSLQGAD